MYIFIILYFGWWLWIYFSYLGQAFKCTLIETIKYILYMIWSYKFFTIFSRFIFVIYSKIKKLLILISVHVIININLLFWWIILYSCISWLSQSPFYIIVHPSRLFTFKITKSYLGPGQRAQNQSQSFRMLLATVGQFNNINCNILSSA